MSYCSASSCLTRIRESTSTASRCRICSKAANKPTLADEGFSSDTWPHVTTQDLVTALSGTGSKRMPVWELLLLPRAEINYQNELWSSSDKEVLAKTVRSWRLRSKDLCPFFTETVQSTSQLQPDSFDVSWKATWVPRQLLWLDSLGKAWPGVNVEYYDVLDRYDQQSQFKWKALFNLFAMAFRTGVLRLPVSSIESKWTVQVAHDGESVSLNERTWLIPMFQQLKVKNRRIARDMLQWQEVRQPADMNYTMWDGKVMQSLQIDEVPGMGQFDIDGVNSEDRNNLYGDALAVMSFAFVIILSFGLSYAWVLSRNYTASYDMDPNLMQLLSDM